MHGVHMTKRCRFCLTLAVFAGMPVAAFSQDTANPLMSGQKFIYSMASKAVIGAAEKMPEENYSFKPTPDVRTFGEIVGHVADSQYMFCSPLSGEQGQMKGVAQSKTSKADLVQALKDSVAYCMKAYDGMTDAQASQMVKVFGRDSAKLTLLSFNSAHTDEHYGNMVTYLRLKNIVPPTSEQSRPGAEKKR